MERGLRLQPMRLQRTFLPYLVIVAVVMSIYSILLVHLTKSFQPSSWDKAYSSGSGGGGGNVGSGPWNQPTAAPPLPCVCSPESAAGLEARREVVIGLSYPFHYFNSNHWFHISEYYVSRHMRVAPKLPQNATVYIVAPHAPDELFVSNLIPMTFFLLLLAFTDGTARTVEVVPQSAMTQLEAPRQGGVLMLDNTGVESYVYDSSLPPFKRTRRYKEGERQQLQHPRGLVSLEGGGEEDGEEEEEEEERKVVRGGVSTAVAGAGGVPLSTRNAEPTIAADPPNRGITYGSPAASTATVTTATATATATAGATAPMRDRGRRLAARGDAPASTTTTATTTVDSNRYLRPPNRDDARDDEEEGAGPEPPTTAAGVAAGPAARPAAGTATGEETGAEEGAGAEAAVAMSETETITATTAAAAAEAEAKAATALDAGAKARGAEWGGYTNEVEEGAEFLPLSSAASGSRGRPCACARYIGEFGAVPVDRGSWFKEEKVENTRARIDALCGDIYRHRWQEGSAEAGAKGKGGGSPNNSGNGGGGGGNGDSSRRRKLVIYQRDNDRRLLGLDENVAVFRELLGANWLVVPIVHDNAHEPCWLYSQLMDADMLLTPHGFQSMLLLFLPPGATILEVFPYKYWKEGYAPLANEWGVRHEYIMSRSVSWAKRLALFFVPLESCMRNIYCRKWSRGADVLLEDHHLRQIVEAAKEASRQREVFLPPPSPPPPATPAAP